MQFDNSSFVVAGSADRERSKLAFTLPQISLQNALACLRLTGMFVLVVWTFRTEVL